MTAESATGCSSGSAKSGGTPSTDAGSPQSTPACGHLVLASPMLMLPLKYAFAARPKLLQTGDPNTVVLRYSTQGYDAGSNDLQFTCRYQFLSPWGGWNDVELTPGNDPQEGCLGPAAGASGAAFEVLASNGFLLSIAAGGQVGNPVPTIPVSPRAVRIEGLLSS